MKSLLLLALLCSGCVQTYYTRTISVTRDAKGEIIQTTKTESVMQAGQHNVMNLELIDGIQVPPKLETPKGGAKP
jgi:PBP1b-binding outer membrane lipoprotein LpoB